MTEVTTRFTSDSAVSTNSYAPMSANAPVDVDAALLRRIAIEQPAPGVLLLRFVYRGKRALPVEPLTEAERGALRSAYLAADRDFVAALRSLQAHGALATLLRLHAPPGSFPNLQDAR